MRKIIGSSLFAGAAAAGVIALSASAAFASGWTVVNTNADAHVTATSASVLFKEVTTSQLFTCAKSTITGILKTGTDLSNPLVTDLRGTFTDCAGALGSTGSGQLSDGAVNGTSYDSGTDTVGGDITGIAATLTINSFVGTCTATVAGSIGTAGNTITYANGTGTLTTAADPPPQQLEITSTSGTCLGLINVGDPVTFSATYTVTDPVPPPTIRPT